MAIEDTHQAIDTGKGPTDQADFMALGAERIADRMRDVISDIDEQTDNLGAAALTEQSAELRPQVCPLQAPVHQLAALHRTSAQALARLLIEKIEWVDGHSRKRLREIAERTARFSEDIDSAAERAAVTLEELNIQLSEQTNRAMYVLAIVAAIFLPPGVLTGLLAINV